MNCLDCVADTCLRAGKDGKPLEDDCFEGRVRAEAQDVEPVTAPHQEAAVNRIERVYIFGPMTGLPAEYLHNCGVMLRMWHEVTMLGMAAFCPAVDALLGMQHGSVAGYEGAPLTIEQYRLNSLKWLDVSDVLYGQRRTRLDGSRSDGIEDELAHARHLGIPVVWSIEELCALRGTEPVV